MLIESDGLLFRGSSPDEPTEIWHYTQKTWVPYQSPGQDGPKPFGIQIDENRAEALKVDNIDAEHFLYYDFPPWLNVDDQ